MTEPPGLCRDCAAVLPPERAAGCACGSRRPVRHPELLALPIAHVDCDLAALAPLETARRFGEGAVVRGRGLRL